MSTRKNRLGLCRAIRVSARHQEEAGEKVENNDRFLQSPNEFCPTGGQCARIRANYDFRQYKRPGLCESFARRRSDKS